jgi:hypothetical protein
VNAKSSEANLNYPNMPDEQLHYLVFRVEVDDAPTQQQIRGVRGVKPAGRATDCQMEGNSLQRTGPLNNQIQQTVPAIYLSPERTRSRAPDGSEKSADTLTLNQLTSLSWGAAGQNPRNHKQAHAVQHESR